MGREAPPGHFGSRRGKRRGGPHGSRVRSGLPWFRSLLPSRGGEVTGSGGKRTLTGGLLSVGEVVRARPRSRTAGFPIDLVFEVPKPNA